MKIEIRSKEHGLVVSKEERVKMKVLMAARPDDVRRVAQMLGGDEEMAAFFIVKDGGDIDLVVKKLEEGLERLAKQLFSEAKAMTPVDTGLLKSVGSYAAGKIRGEHIVAGHGRRRKKR